MSVVLEEMMDRLKQNLETTKKGIDQKILPLVPAPGDEHYKKYPNRGEALIFNHKFFKPSTHQHTRNGTERDGIDLKNILHELKFNVHLYEDLDYDGIRDRLNKVASMDHSNSECILIAVMTHGDEEILYASDKEYQLKRLWTPFTPIHCPSLAGKPKLFFIQSCRGDRIDPGFMVMHDETDSGEEKQMVYTIPVMADFLFMYATVKGYFAWRDPETGSPFIQALVKQLKLHHTSKDLLSILTNVNREVAVNFFSDHPHPEYDRKKEMCSIVSTLTRQFRF